jgi:hypothetical protein
VQPCNQAARLLEMNQGGAAMREFVGMVNDFNDIMAHQVLYITFHGINIFLCLLRFLKAGLHKLNKGDKRQLGDSPP